jgi:glycerate kinase
MARSQSWNAAAARARNVPTVVLAGRVAADPALLHQHGIHAAHATHAPEMPLAEVLRRESELLSAAARSWLQDEFQTVARNKP